MSMGELVFGITPFVRRNMAISGGNLSRFRITCMNCPTVMSFGTRYFFLSRVGKSLNCSFSHTTGILSGYALIILVASSIL